MAYNLSGISGNTTGVLSMVQGVNDVLLFGWFGVLILLAVFFISLISFIMGTQQASKALIGASFVSMVISFLLFIIDLVPSLAVLICVLLFAGSAVMGMRDS